MSVKAFLEAATSQLGVPYSWGNDTPSSGFDCSGLVYWAAAQAGHPLGVRTSQDMYKTLPTVDRPGVGDLVMFGSGTDATHVGICNNAGCSQMINAPNSGSVVRFDAIPPVGQYWGTEQVLGYRAVPGISGTGGASGGGSSLGNDLSGTISSIAGGLNPLSWGTNTVEKPLLEAVGKLPGLFVDQLTGGHSLGEISFRFVELVGGSIVLVIGLYTFTKLLMEQTGTTSTVQSGTSAVRSGGSRVRSTAGQVREGRVTLADQRMQEQADQETATNADIKKRKQTSSTNGHAARAKSYRKNTTGDEPF